MSAPQLIANPAMFRVREEDGSLLVCNELLISARDGSSSSSSCAIDNVAPNLKPLIPRGAEFTFTTSTAIAIICSNTDSRYNVCGTIFPMYVLEGLVRKALTYEAMRSFFAFCADFSDEIEVKLYQGGDRDTITKVKAMDESAIDATIDELRSQLLEFRSLSPTTAAVSNGSFAACIAAKWLSSTRALGIGLTEQEDVAAIAKRIQKLSNCSASMGVSEEEAREGKVQAIREDARLLLDIRIFLERVIDSLSIISEDIGVPSVSADNSIKIDLHYNSDSSSGAIVLHLLLAELLGFCSAYDECCAHWHQLIRKGPLNSDNDNDLLHLICAACSGSSESEGKTIISLFANHTRDLRYVLSSPLLRAASPPSLSSADYNLFKTSSSSSSSSYYSGPSALMADEDDFNAAINRLGDFKAAGPCTPEPAPAPRPHSPPTNIHPSLPAPEPLGLEVGTSAGDERTDFSSPVAEFSLLRTPRHSDYDPSLLIAVSRRAPSGNLYSRDGHFVGRGSSEGLSIAPTPKGSEGARRCLDYGGSSSSSSSMRDSSCKGPFNRPNTINTLSTSRPKAAKIATSPAINSLATTKYTTSAEDSNSSIAINSTSKNPSVEAEAGRKKAILRLQEARRKVEFDEVSKRSKNHLRESRLKSVELRAVMARVGYGGAAVCASQSPIESCSRQRSKSESIFHRSRLMTTAEVATATLEAHPAQQIQCSSDSGGSEALRSDKISTVARRRAADRIRQHKLRQSLLSERLQEEARSKEALKWRERDRKIASFLQRRAIGVDEDDVLSRRAPRGPLAARESPRPAAGAEPWSPEPWARAAPSYHHPLDRRGGGASYDALRAVGLAPSNYNHNLKDYSFGSSSSSGSRVSSSGGYDDYDDLSSQDSAVTRNTLANRTMVPPATGALMWQHQQQASSVRSSSGRSSSSDGSGVSCEDELFGDAQFTDLILAATPRPNPNPNPNPNPRSTTVSKKASPAPRAAKAATATLLSPTSVAGLQSNPTTPIVKQSQPKNGLITPSQTVSVVVKKAWGLPEGTVYTNPYVVIDWGRLGRAATSAVANTTSPLFACSLKFRSPLVREEGDEEGCLVPPGCCKSAVVIAGVKYISVAPQMRAFVYNRIEGASDELLGEGEVDSSSALGGGPAVSSLSDMDGGFAGYLELEMRLIQS